MNYDEALDRDFLSSGWATILYSYSTKLRRMKSRNRFLVLLWLLVVFVSPLSARTITVVFDDSGSMKINERWSHASYSLQALRSLMDSSDQLNVVFMNRKGTPESFGGSTAQVDVDKIRAIARIPSEQTATPYDSVGRAINVVKQTKDSDQWLVVITDGKFDGVPPDIAVSIRRFVDEVPSIKTILLGIAQKEENSVFTAWRQIAGADVFFAEKVEEIIPVMAEVGARLTGLGGGKEPLQPVVNGRQLEITPQFPLKRLVLLQQASSRENLAAVNGATLGNRPFSVSTPINVEAPGALKTSAAIYHIAPQDQKTLPAGQTIKVDLGSSVAAANKLSLYVEPDAKFSVEIRDDRGNQIMPVNGVYTVCIGRNSRLQLKIDAPVSEKPIDLSRIQAKVRIGNREAQMAVADGNLSADLDLPEGLQLLTVVASLPGYFNFQQNAQIRLAKCKPRTITLSAKSEGTPGDVVQPWSFKVTEIDKTPRYEIYPLVNGQRVSAEEFKLWKTTLDVGSLSADVQRTDSGWTISPKYKWGTPVFTPAGKFPINLAMETTFQDDVQDFPANLSVDVIDPGFMERYGPFLGKVLGAILGLIYVYGIINKSRINKSAVIELTTGDSSLIAAGMKLIPKTSYPPHGLFNRWLIPFVPEKWPVGGLQFYATKRGVAVPYSSLPDKQFCKRDRMEFDKSKRRDLDLGSGMSLEFSGKHNKKFVYRTKT